MEQENNPINQRLEVGLPNQFEERTSRREQQVNEFIHATEKINFKIAVLRHIANFSKTNKDTKKLAEFAAILLRRTERVFAKSQSIGIAHESFEELGSPVTYDPDIYDEYDTFQGEINVGDKVIVVQPALIGYEDPGFYPEFAHKARVCPKEWFLSAGVETTIKALHEKNAVHLADFTFT